MKKLLVVAGAQKTFCTENKDQRALLPTLLVQEKSRLHKQKLDLTNQDLMIWASTFLVASQ